MYLDKSSSHGKVHITGLYCSTSANPVLCYTWLDGNNHGHDYNMDRTVTQTDVAVVQISVYPCWLGCDAGIRLVEWRHRAPQLAKKFLTFCVFLSVRLDCYFLNGLIY